MFELHPFSLPDGPTLVGWATSREFLLQWVGPTFAYPLDLAQIEVHLRQATGPEPSILPFKLVETETDEMVGYIEFCSIERENRSGMLGRVIVGAEKRRGQGVGTWMVREATRIGFEELGLHRISLVVFDFNHAAIACYRRAGFRFEGTLREARRIGDDYWTLHSMSILEREWSPCPRPPDGSGSSIIEEMAPGDWNEVRTIYVEGIATGNATFETGAPPWTRWDQEHLPSCRLVARSEEGVIGWAALSPVSRRPVYAGVVEVSVYVAAAARGRGVGRALIEDLIRQSEAAGIWTLQAGVFPENVASTALLKRCGFREVGVRERLGAGGGQWRDVLLLERRSRS